MRRLSARIIIALPWILTLILVMVTAQLGVAPAIFAVLAGSGVAWITGTTLTRRLKELSRDIRARRFATNAALDLTEIAAVRDAVNASGLDAVALAASAGLAEQRLLAVIESISEGILQINTQGRFVHVNPAGRELLNLPAHVAGQSVAAVIRHPELRQCIERAATGASFDPREFVFEDRHLLVSSQPLRSEKNSEVSGAVVSVVDLTEFRRLESVRRDFVANVSHELKTPLTSIRGYAETLLTDDTPEELRRQFLEVIHKNAERIQRIVDDLLDLSRLQSGGWQPELQEVDPATLAEDVWAGCESAQRKHLNFKVVAPPERDVLADPGGLRQVLSNLFDNAIRYTPEGGDVGVVIRAGRQPRYIDLVITDNGSGIPREALPRIFERFYRVDPARSRQEGGTGLGLSIVKHLVERMDGEVSAESELGKGTTIRVSLPAAAAS
jgi:PAS domain S-box-containing protein